MRRSACNILKIVVADADGTNDTLFLKDCAGTKSMQAGQGRSCTWCTLLVPVVMLVAGCATGRHQLEQALLADKNPAAHDLNLGAHYRVQCPDVLSIQVQGHPELSGPQQLGADGRIIVGHAGRVRAAGATTPEIAAAVAQLAEVPRSQVQVQVAKYNSQQLYLIGQVNGYQIAVPYRGPETVLDLLQRVGGLTPAAAPQDIQVVRSQVAAGKPPIVFQVDLQAIVLEKDQNSNIRLQPFDQIYIAENRQAAYATCLPPWIRPLYTTLCGMGRR